MPQADNNARCRAVTKCTHCAHIKEGGDEMSDTQKQGFLHGAALLTIATIVVKVLGLLYKIPMNYIIGEEGFGYFNTAYEIYNVLLLVSTAGLPVAMSRKIANACSLGDYNQVHRIYVTARGIFLGLGIVGSLLMTVFCRQLAAFQNQPDAWAAIGLLGPCVLLICIMSTYRGFFQGQSNMIPTSVSQVLEAVVKLVVGIVAATIVIRRTGSIPLAAGGAIMGVTVSCMVSCVYLYIYFRRYCNTLPKTNDTPLSYMETARGLMLIAIPITVGSAGLQVLTVLETKLYMGQLLALGMTQREADITRGIYGMTQTIFALPCSLISPIAISIIPAITECLTLEKPEKAKKTAEAGARVAGLLSMPCAVGLIVLAEPITALLGNYSGEKLVLATRSMSVLGVVVVFNAMSTFTTAVMQAHGHINRPVANMFIGGFLNLIAVYVLTANPLINILGAPIGLVVCYSSISILNIGSIRRLVSDPPSILRNLWRSLIASLIMGAFTYGTLLGLHKLGIYSRLLCCMVPILVAVVVYAACIAPLRVITREDCERLPKGRKIARLLRL